MVSGIFQDIQLFFSSRPRIPLKARFAEWHVFISFLNNNLFPLHCGGPIALSHCGLVLLEGPILYTPEPDSLYYLSNGAQNFEHSL